MTDPTGKVDLQIKCCKYISWKKMKVTSRTQNDPRGYSIMSFVIQK
jgi:hypothetical protein